MNSEQIDTPPVDEDAPVVKTIEEVDRWWHGGPRIDGDLILPPSVTGASSTFDIAGSMGLRDVENVVSADHVFLTARRDVATMFASVHRTPWIYEVEPIGVIELDPDYMGSNADMASVMCASARIVRRFNPSARDRDGWRRTIARIARKKGLGVPLT